MSRTIIAVMALALLLTATPALGQVEQRIPDAENDVVRIESRATASGGGGQEDTNQSRPDVDLLGVRTEATTEHLILTLTVVGAIQEEAEASATETGVATTVWTYTVALDTDGDGSDDHVATYADGEATLKSNDRDRDREIPIDHRIQGGTIAMDAPMARVQPTQALIVIGHAMERQSHTSDSGTTVITWTDSAQELPDAEDLEAQRPTGGDEDEDAELPGPSFITLLLLGLAAVLVSRQRAPRS